MTLCALRNNPRDKQREKVYSWERQHVPHGDPIPFDQIAAFTAKVWEAEGLKHPPRVEAFPKHMKRREGDATRLVIRFHARGTTSNVVLHELAHAMTSDIDGRTDLHNALFVGVYMGLLSRHAGIPLFSLWHTAKICGVAFDLNASLTLIGQTSIL